MSLSKQIPADLEDRQWFIFTNRGTASLAIGDSLTQALADWKKRKGNNASQIIGAIKAGGPVPIDRMHMSGTQVFGVICCAQSPEKQNPQFYV